MPRSSTERIACLLAMCLALGTSAIRADEPVDVLLHTESGDIVLALDAQHAPITTANFLRYVDEHRYDGAAFYRAVKVDEEGHYGLVQGGLHGGHARPAEAAKAPRSGQPGKAARAPRPPAPIPPIAHESPAQTGLHHVDGAISMARKEPGTATSEFFIVIGELTSLDGQDGDPGYAVFGHVASGMQVASQMLLLPRSAETGDGSMGGQMLASPVKIISARRVVAATPAPGPTPDTAP